MNITNQTQQQSVISQETQIKITQQTQYLYQDLMYIFGIAVETQEVLENLKDQPNHPMINISLNRMILQANQSNQVANQMNEVSKQEGINDKLILEKEQVKKYYKELRKNRQFDERINALLSEYETVSLSKNPFLINKPSLPMGQETIEINSKVVQQIVDAMGHQDQMNANISKDPNTYKKPTVEEMKQINIQRQENAQQKIFLNLTLSDINKQLLNKCSKFNNTNETTQILDKYFKQIETHLKDFENTNQFNKINEELKFSDDQQKEQFRHVLRLLISYDLGTLDTYFCQTLQYLSEKEIVKKITKNIQK